MINFGSGWRANMLNVSKGLREDTLNPDYFDTIDELLDCYKNSKYLRVVQKDGRYGGEGFNDAKAAKLHLKHFGGRLFRNKNGEWSYS